MEFFLCGYLLRLASSIYFILIFIYLVLIFFRLWFSKNQTRKRFPIGSNGFWLVLFFFFLNQNGLVLGLIMARHFFSIRAQPTCHNHNIKSYLSDFSADKTCIPTIISPKKQKNVFNSFYDSYTKYFFFFIIICL